MSSLEQTTESTGIFTRERLAWSVVGGAFLIFCLLLVVVPYGVNRVLQNTTTSHSAQVQGTRGKTTVELPGTRQAPAAVLEGSVEQIGESTILRTDDAQASISLFDGSTITVFPDSKFEVQTMRTPRFTVSRQANLITVALYEGGRVRIQVAESRGRPTRFLVYTEQAVAPQGYISLAPGSYAIETTQDTTHVSVRSGAAEVTGQTGAPVALQPAERAEVSLGQAARGPFPAKRNILVNSDFQNVETATPISNGTLAEGWQVTSEQGGDGGGVDGVVEVEHLGTSRALHFLRQGSGQNHGETAVIQVMNQRVADYLSLALRFDVRLLYQELSGGGVQSSEFPLIVRVDYMDGTGTTRTWTKGFYYQNESGYNIVDGEMIPQDSTYRFEVDLKEALLDPQLIYNIRFYASGWDWDVYVSEVELIGE